MIENLKIELNASIIQRMKAEDIYPDHMCSVIAILIALSKKRIDLLDELDDSSKSKRLLLLYKQMQHRNLLEEDNGKYLFKLTGKGINLVKFIESEFSKENVDIDALVLENKPNKNAENIDEWVKEYNEIFPSARQGNEAVLARRIKVFINTFPQFDKNSILGGTRMYVKDYLDKTDDLTYMRNANYFIFKGQGMDRTWDLATWCKRYLEKDNAPNFDTNFMDIV